MKTYVVNETISQGTKDFLNARGRVLGVRPHPTLPLPEQCHADMQFTKIDDKTLVCAPGAGEERIFSAAGIRLIPGETPLRSAYPGNIPYNLLQAGHVCFHNTKYTDPRVKKILLRNGFRFHHVRQGYAGCSSVPIPYADGKTFVLSSDRGIVSAITALRLPQLTAAYFTATAEIVLDGYDHGLIGGCGGYDRDCGLLLYGNANRQLQALSVQYGFQILSVYDGPLTDIGGILVMYPDL